MATTLIIRHRVADYDAWHPFYLEHSAIRQQHGITGERVHRDVDDPNVVTVVADAADVDRVRAFLADPSLRETMGRAGVVSQPDIFIANEA